MLVSFHSVDEVKVEAARPTVSGRNTEAMSHSSTISTDYSVAALKSRLPQTSEKRKSRGEELRASRSEDMSMRAVRPPDDPEEARAMLGKASALGVNMLVPPPCPPPVPGYGSVGEDRIQLGALVR